MTLIYLKPTALICLKYITMFFGLFMTSVDLKPAALLCLKSITMLSSSQIVEFY